MGDDLEGDLGLVGGDTWFQSGEDLQFAVGAIGEEAGAIRADATHADGRVDVHLDDGVRTVELLFDHADYGGLLAIEAYAAANNAGVACEAFLPVAVAQDHDVGGTESIAFAGVDEATDCRANTEHCEEIAGDFGGDHTIGAAAGAQAYQVETVGGHVGEDSGLLFVVEEIEIRDTVWVGLGGVLDGDYGKAVGVFYREGTEQEDVGDAEDGGVCADAQG